MENGSFNRNIVLVGFMGTGKSTVGLILAEKLGWRFIDTDQWIEQNQVMSIPDIFEKYGESHFRAVEIEAVRQVLSNDQQVVATGGGAVLAEGNRLQMQQNGFVVALKASPETIIQRVRQDQNRPLLQGDLEQRVNKLLEQRKHAYDFADLIIETSNLTLQDIVDRILESARSSV